MRTNPDNFWTQYLDVMPLGLRQELWTELVGLFRGMG